ncbi:MAG: TonB family protein [Aridibacter sp.]
MRKIILFLVFGFLFAQVQYSQNNSGRNIGDVCNSLATYLPVPNFSDEAKMNVLASSINVKVWIDEQGSVTKAKALSEYPNLNSEAEKEALKAKFKITKRSGIPVKFNCIIVFNFRKSEIHKEEHPIISLGVLNDKAKILPMPKSPHLRSKNKGEILVDVKVNLQTGKVVSATVKEGHPLLRKPSISSAKKTEFEPILTEFPTIYATGTLVYKFKDFNGKTIENSNPKPFPIIKKEGFLNDKAKYIPKVSTCAGGNVEAMILVNIKGEVIFAKAILGDRHLFELIEEKALEIKFSAVNVSFPLYVIGKILFSFPAKRCSKGIINGQAKYLPPPKVENLNLPKDFKISDKHLVVVVVQIENEGNVISAKAVRGHPLLREICEEAARKAIFIIPKKSKYTKVREGVLVYSFNSDLTSNINYSDERIITIDHFPVGTKPIFMPQPEYPAAAKTANIKGEVVVQILVDEKGNVEEAEIVSGHPLLKVESLRVAKLTKFKPPTLSGKPIKVKSTIIYNFEPELKEEITTKTSDKIILGELIKFLLPTYPFCNCKFGGKESTVGVQVEIDEEGNVILAQGISGHPIQKGISTTAARHSKFSPTIISGKTVKAKAILIYTFDNENTKVKGVSVKLIEPIY